MNSRHLKCCKIHAKYSNIAVYVHVVDSLGNSYFTATQRNIFPNPPFRHKFKEESGKSNYLSFSFHINLIKVQFT